MRVNSDETIRRAIRFREKNGDKSWLELTRDPDNQRQSRKFFAGGLRAACEDTSR